MIDDRPIKPDPKYISQFLERINKIQVKPYLKKNKEAVLPCHQYIHDSGKKENHYTQPQTKAQIYETIKQKNIAKFGEKKPPEVKIQEKKTIHPKKMTINYKPKIFIQTQQIKKIDNPNRIKPVPKPVDKQKIEYQKLLDYFKGEINTLEKEKEQFAKVADKLKFKELIGQEDELIFAKIKCQVENNLILQHFKHDDSNNKIRNHNGEGKGQNRERKQIKKQKLISKVCTVKEIQNRMQRTAQQLQQLKDQMTHVQMRGKK